MQTGAAHRLISAVGAAVIAASTVIIANSPSVQSTAASLPTISTLAVESAVGGELFVETLFTAVVVCTACFPLYKPRPRRILDTIALTHKRIFVAVLALATLGYFDYTYRLPRLTLILVTPLLLTVLPMWFVWLRKRPNAGEGKDIIVGDDYEMINQVVSEASLEFLGYLCPTASLKTPIESDTVQTGAVADGGSLRGLNRLGGLSRIDDTLIEYNIDTVVLAFAEADRAEFFGVLDACYEYGVEVKVHKGHADTVLTAEDSAGTLVDVDVEPWDAQDYSMKRGFDIMFALAGIVLLLPVIVMIALAIKLEDGGSILYQQERTALFGETFTISKFRSMTEDAEAQTGVTISDEDAGGVDPRVTRVGSILRQTHLDEIPQLWSVLRGDMSVVGPRPERPELDADIRGGVIEWQKRWFVKPGLTGPAQVNDVTGANPEQKIRYDLLYVRKQSFGYDLKLITRQIWKVIQDAYKVISSL